jgi:hypothetical protein
MISWEDMTARLLRIVAFVCVALLAGCAAAAADRRVALVIGNSEYAPQAPRLANPRNDAQDVAETLTALGFEVIVRVDADRQRFMQALAEFSRAATGAEVALFFFAGHGLQMNGSNYLVPVGAQLQDEVSVQFDFIALEEIRRALERSAGAKVLILDACRNNPFTVKLERSLKAASRDMTVLRGLAPPPQTRGTVVAYATQANDVAADGDERNSPFTGALVLGLREPGLEIGALFRKVATRVYDKTRGRQMPELSISLPAELYLNRGETDAQVWARIRVETDPAAFREFLARFRDSFYAPDARLRLDLLERADQEKELRERLKALEVDRLQAEMNLRAATLAAREAADRLRQEQAERARLAAEVASRQREVAEATQQLSDETAKRGRLSAEAGDKERALRARLAELEQASRKAAADLAAREQTSATDTAAKDRQIAALEQARRDAEAQIAALTEQARLLREQAQARLPAPATPAAPPAATTAAPAPPVPPAAALAPEKPPVLDEGQLVIAIKTELGRLGCLSAPIDADWQSPAVRKAVADFAARTHLAKIPDSPAQQLLEDLKARGGRICAPECGPREHESNGKCVPKICAGNQVLDRAGNCVARPAEPKPARPEPPAVPRPPGRAGCFTFNGKQFCE